MDVLTGFDKLFSSFEPCRRIVKLAQKKISPRVRVLAASSVLFSMILIFVCGSSIAMLYSCLSTLLKAEETGEIIGPAPSLNK